MRMKPDVFSPLQLDFLSALAMIEEPVSLDFLVALTPLPPDSLVSLVKMAEQLGMITHSDSMIQIAPDIPENLAALLRNHGTPKFAGTLLARLAALDTLETPSHSLRANLSARAGFNFEAASFEYCAARECMNGGNANSTIRHLKNAAGYLIDILGKAKSDSLFVSVVLDLSHTYYLIGEGYPEIPQLLDTARKATERLGDERSQAMVSLHVGRFFFLSDRLADAIDILSEGLRKVKELGDDDILSQSAEFEGLYYYLHGKYREAATLFDKALHNVPKRNIKLFNIFLPANLGYCYALLGQYHRSIGVLDSSLKRAQLCSEPCLATFFRSILGTVLIMMGKMDEALIQLKKAKQEAVPQDNKLALFFTQRSMAYYLFLRDRPKDSYDLIAEAIQSAIGDKTISLQNTWPWLLNMLYAYNKLGFPPIEGLDFEQEMEKSLNGPNVHLRGVALRIRAHQAMLQGEGSDVVRTLLMASKDDLKLSGNPIELARTIAEIARLEYPAGRPEVIQQYLLDVTELAAGFEREFVPAEMRSLLTNETDSTFSPDTTLERFMEMIHEFLPSPENEELYYRVIRATCRFFGAERGGLFWFTSDKKKVRSVLRASYNLSNIEVNAESFQSNMSLILKTYQNNQPLLMRPNQAGTEADNRRSLFILCLPLEISGTVQGVMYHENSYLKDSLSSLDRAMLFKIMRHINRYFERIDIYSHMVQNRLQPDAVSGLSISTAKDGEEIKTENPVMLNLLARADNIAATDAPVLILGETGVGKELLARRLHAKSSRCSQPFVVVNLTTVPENLMESELFGHEKGSFTGADQRKQGRFELAHKGTLFLDEIGEIPQSIQVKLLRVLQEKSFTRLGGQNLIESDFRLIAATNRDLAREVDVGNFREDLYYRLNVVDLLIPPLRERGDDIALLASFFLKHFTRKYHKGNLALSAEDIKLISGYHWPGNIRELRNFMERAAILSTGDSLELPEIIRRQDPIHTMFSQLPTMDEVQGQYIQYVLHKTGGRVGGPGGAAEILGMKRTTLNFRMKKLGVK